MEIKALLTVVCSSCLMSTYAQLPTDSTAEKMLFYQLGNGGWPKQLVDKSVVNYQAVLTPELSQKIKATEEKHATFDNNATSREIVYLVKAYKKTGNKSYLKAAEKGLDYILVAQYSNGGWPQYYPDQSLYRSEITYNDNAMVNLLNILQDIITQKNDFDVVHPSYVTKAEKAVAKGIDCILKTQVRQDGLLTIWAAQYDKDSLLPAEARAFEPASLSTSESVGITRFLMKIPNPSREIKTAVASALKWFDTYKLPGYRFEKELGKDASLVADPGGMVWARFYDLQRNVPIFGDRDKTIKFRLEDLSLERRNGYAWYGSWAQKLIEKEYPKWLSINGIQTKSNSSLQEGK